MDRVSGDDKRSEEAVSCTARTVDCAIACAIASLSRCDGDLNAKKIELEKRKRCEKVETD